MKLTALVGGHVEDSLSREMAHSIQFTLIRNKRQPRFDRPDRIVEMAGSHLKSVSSLVTLMCIRRACPSRARQTAEVETTEASLVNCEVAEVGQTDAASLLRVSSEV